MDTEEPNPIYTQEDTVENQLLRKMEEAIAKEECQRLIEELNNVERTNASKRRFNMAAKTFEEQIKDYDARSDIHYHVYFSSASYIYCVDVLQFKKKSDIKNEYYKDKKYYSTYAEAKKVADKLNEKDTDVGHLFGRAASEFSDRLYDLLKMGGMTDAQKHAIEAANANVQAIAKLVNNEHF